MRWQSERSTESRYKETTENFRGSTASGETGKQGEVNEIIVISGFKTYTHYRTPKHSTAYPNFIIIRCDRRRARCSRLVININAGAGAGGGGGVSQRSARRHVLQDPLVNKRVAVVVGVKARSAAATVTASLCPNGVVLSTER
jgi:hypothetical protein